MQAVIAEQKRFRYGVIVQPAFKEGCDYGGVCSVNR